MDLAETLVENLGATVRSKTEGQVRIKRTQVSEPEVVAEHKSLRIPHWCSTTLGAMQLVRFEIQNLDAQHMKSQDPIRKEPKPNKEMTKTCSPHTTPSQQDKIQATKCAKNMGTTALQNAFWQKRTPRMESLLLSSNPRFSNRKPPKGLKTKQGNDENL